MKRFLCAIAFLTRFPIPPKYNFGAEDVGKSTLFFPLVGFGLGAIQLAFLELLKFGGVSFDTNLKAILAAILLLIINALATGALHFDGLADMADGFGGGARQGKNPADYARFADRQLRRDGFDFVDFTESNGDCRADSIAGCAKVFDSRADVRTLGDRAVR